MKWIRPEGEEGSAVQWMHRHKDQFEQDLAIHGSIVLSGFDVRNAVDFRDFMECFNTEPLPYMFRSSPRQELDKSIQNIYLSTSYPQDRPINLHNECSYSRVWGRKIVFCCIKPADEGGETPIADSRKVLQDIDPSLVRKFRSRGVRYRRNLLQSLGMPWQEVFQTTDKQVAMETCKKNDIDYSFSSKGDMQIEWVKPAIYNHPVTGEETWFNHVMFFNRYSYYEELGLDYADYLPDRYLTAETFFGDGTPITHEEYLNIRQAFLKNRIDISYKQGDILFLDNMLSAHGRNPYKGERIIATAIIEPACDPGYTYAHS
jgi:alpha-ketoglutarate-dependent taurine dioxygenase